MNRLLIAVAFFGVLLIAFIVACIIDAVKKYKYENQDEEKTYE